jgi:hypothetical protein
LHTLFHNSHHAGQISLTLSKGAAVQNLWPVQAVEAVSKVDICLWWQNYISSNKSFVPFVKIFVLFVLKNKTTRGTKDTKNPLSQILFCMRWWTITFDTASTNRYTLIFKILTSNSRWVNPQNIDIQLWHEIVV